MRVIKFYDKIYSREKKLIIIYKTTLLVKRLFSTK